MDRFSLACVINVAACANMLPLTHDILLSLIPLDSGLPASQMMTFRLVQTLH